jgi:sulfatase modifying factor 1
MKTKLTTLGLTLVLATAALAAPPQAVTDLSITVVDSAHVQLDWSPVAHDTAGQGLLAPLYQIHARPEPWFEPTLATRLITTSAHDQLLPIADSLACFQVVVVDEPQDMVRIPAGQFMMGQAGVATPEHQVTLTNDFLLGRTEVTNAEFLEALNWAKAQGLVSVVGDVVQQYGVNLLQIWSNCNFLEILYDTNTQTFHLNAGTCNGGNWGPGSAYPGGNYDPSNHPVKHVSWFGAACYCDWRSQMENLPRYYEGQWSQIPSPRNPYTATGYRLPTEAEWEFASQFGGERTYPWGSTTPTCTQGNYLLCVGWTSPVGALPAGASALGLQDVAGNVFEWCNDWYSGYSSSPQSNQVGPSSGYSRVLRGGGWHAGAGDLRCAVRYENYPSDFNYNLGFRLCRAAP